MDTRHAQALEERGFRRFDQGRYGEAEEAFRLAAILRPDSGDAWVGLGSALGKQGRHEEAGMIFGIACLCDDDAWPALLAAEAFLCCGQHDHAGAALSWVHELATRGHVSDEQREVATTLRESLRGAGR